MPLLPQSWLDSIHNALGIDTSVSALTPEQQQQLRAGLDAYDEANGDQLRDAGVEFLEALVTGEGVDIPGLMETLSDIDTFMEKLAGFEVEPDDHKTRVVKASDVLEVMLKFRTENLIDFYRDKFEQIKGDVEGLSNENFTPILDNFKKGNITETLSGILKVVDNIVKTAIDVEELFTVLDDALREIVSKELDQSKPELRRRKDAGGLTRNPQLQAT